MSTFIFVILSDAQNLIGLEKQLKENLKPMNDHVRTSQLLVYPLIERVFVTYLLLPQ